MARTDTFSGILSPRTRWLKNMSTEKDIHLPLDGRDFELFTFQDFIFYRASPKVNFTLSFIITPSLIF
jgi:hypothetical protein